MQSDDTDQPDRAANGGTRAGRWGPRKLGGSARGAAVRSGTPPNRRPVKRLTVFVAAVSAAGAIVGCGAGSVAKEIGVAACRQTASSLSDPTARQIADQACQVGASGSLTQATQAAKQAAHDACVKEAQKIVDPTARQQITAACPTVK